MSSIPGWELRTHMLHDWAKKKKRILSLGPNPRGSASVALELELKSVFPRGPRASQMTLMLSWPRTGPCIRSHCLKVIEAAARVWREGMLLACPDEAAAGLLGVRPSVKDYTLSSGPSRACCKVEVPGDSCVPLFSS